MAKQASFLTFVHITEPNQGRLRNHRSRVRSHVTRRQHAQRREEDMHKVTAHEGEECAEGCAGGMRPEERFQDPRAHAITNRSHRSPQSNASSQFAPVVARDVFGAAFSRGTMAFRTFALNDAENATGEVFHHLNLDVSTVLKFYEHIVRAQSGHIQKKYATGITRSAAHHRFMSFMFSDPATLTTALFISVRGLLAPSEQPVPTEYRPYLLQLQSFLLRSVNAALCDRKRSLSDHMLICISLLASYEAKYGDRSAYLTHMRGLVQMINLRGGLPAIGLRSDWVERVLVWSDINASGIAQCDPHYSHMERSSTLQFVEADRKMYTIGRETM